MGLSHNGSEGFERYAERRRGEDAEGTTHRDLGVVLGEVDGILCVEGRLEGGEAGIEGRHEVENCPLQRNPGNRFRGEMI